MNQMHNVHYAQTHITLPDYPKTEATVPSLVSLFEGGVGWGMMYLGHFADNPG